MDGSDKLVRGSMCILNRETIAEDPEYSNVLQELFSIEDSNGSFLVYFSADVCVITNVLPMTFDDDNFIPNDSIFVGLHHLVKTGHIQEEGVFNRWSKEGVFSFVEENYSNAPKNEKMRILGRQGISIADIARLMGLTYQRVRNVLMK